MEIEYIQGDAALRNSGQPLNEGEAFLEIDGKQVQQEIIDRFDTKGYYIGERPTGITARLIVNLYKISIDLMDKFNEHMPGIKLTEIDDSQSYIELALIPSTVTDWNGNVRHDFYISERLNDPLYTRPSKKYKSKIQKANRKWGEDTLNEEQAN